MSNDPEAGRRFAFFVERHIGKLTYGLILLVIGWVGYDSYQNHGLGSAVVNVAFVVTAIAILAGPNWKARKNLDKIQPDYDLIVNTLASRHTELELPGLPARVFLVNGDTACTIQVSKARAGMKWWISVQTSNQQAFRAAEASIDFALSCSRPGYLHLTKREK